MTNVRSESIEETRRNFRRVSWGAIFAGVVVAIVVQLLLTLLGVGIGAATVQPLQQSAPGKGVGIGAAIWFLVSSLIAMYVGASVAAHLSGASRKDRMLHGILTWGTGTLLGFVFLTTAAGSLLGGAGSLLGGATAMANQKQPVYSADQASGSGSQMSLANRQHSGSERASASAQASGGSNPDSALAQTGSDDSSRYQQQASTEQKAREAGDLASRRVSQAALWSFFVLLLSGIVAAFAANSGEEKGAYEYNEGYTGATAHAKV